MKWCMVIKNIFLYYLNIYFVIYNFFLIQSTASVKLFEILILSKWNVATMKCIVVYIDTIAFIEFWDALQVDV